MYATLEDCLLDLEKNNQLIRIPELVDPDLEMAAVHLRVHAMQGPALLFENVKGCRYRAASNIFGTIERSKFIFRNTWNQVEKVIALRNNPMRALRQPFQHLGTAWAATRAMPHKTTSGTGNFEAIHIHDLPLIKHWPQDGGAFVTLPQVYTEDVDHPGVMQSNLGMYRIQLTGNDYLPDQEIGLHYQIHRGIGIHQTKANALGVPLKVSCFVGGHPAHSLAAVMPLPEGISELTFAGMLAGRRFRYHYQDGFCISNDADFVITGEAIPGTNKPEGPFGDHLGYYSLRHPFPVMNVHKVYARRNAIWPFTVVGRPPQEDTAFGALIHELTGDAIPQEIPGVQEVHAVDAAGVHPLLFAVGTERYTPYLKDKKPAEILTQANRILGTGQLSLAKYLFIAASDDQTKLDSHEEASFLKYLLERIDLSRDIHFQTNTTIDTLDYSGSGLNRGSKVVIAACGPVKRELCTSVPEALKNLQNFLNPKLIMPGIVAFQARPFQDYQQTGLEMEALNRQLCALPGSGDKCPLIIICDNSDFIAQRLSNFLWVTFTRSNPAFDIHGINSRTEHKHWSCDQLIIDARQKPHHAPVLESDPAVEQRVDRLFEKGGSLYNVGKQTVNSGK